MRSKLFLAALCAGVFAVVSGPAQAQTETKYVTIDGEVVRYEVGRVIVVRGADNREVTYTLAPSVVMPAEVKVGRQVTLYTEPGRDGQPQLVSRVTTTSVTPDGRVKSTTQDTRNLPSGATSTTTTTNVSGTVQSYEAGKTLTISRSDGSKVTYIINPTSKVPSGMLVGKNVTILPLASSGPGDPVAQTVTYTTTTTTTTEKPPQR